MFRRRTTQATLPITTPRESKLPHSSSKLLPFPLLPSFLPSSLVRKPHGTTRLTSYYFHLHIENRNGLPAWNNLDFRKAFSEAFLSFVISGDPNSRLRDPKILPVWRKWSPANPREMVFNRTEEGDAPSIKDILSSVDLRGRCE